jgi:enhancing lycopene biosynthesis protein 2
MLKVGVVLSGCGVQDGSDVAEAVLTLLALERGGAHIVALAPDGEQAEVVNHYTGQEERLEGRHTLSEAARIVRGKIQSFTEVSAHDVDALILVGGLGAARNLCTYVNDGANATVNPEIGRLIADLNGLGKPIGAIGYSAVVVALALQGRETGTSPVLSVGDDASIVIDLQKLGVEHTQTRVDQVCIDKSNKIVSTGGFLMAQSIGEVEPSISKLVEHVLGFAREINATYAGA